MRLCRPRPLHEQLNRAVSPGIVVLAVGGHGERRHRINLLPSARSGSRLVATTRTAEPARSTASAIAAAASITCSQLSSTSSNRRSASACATRCAEISPPASSSPTAAATVAGTRPGSAQRRKLGEPDPVGKLRPQLARDRQGEPCLADAAGAGQGDEPMRGGKAHDFAQLVVPPDQLGNRLRQVSRRQYRYRLRRGGPAPATLIRARRQDADLAGELVTPSGDRADQPAISTESRAQRRNLDLEGVLFDDLVRPDAAQSARPC